MFDMYRDSGRAWAAVLAQEPDDRRDLMVQVYRELAGETYPTQSRLLRPMIEVEYALNDEALRSVTSSRLEAWLALDPREARSVAAAYDSEMESMSAEAAMKRVAVVQSIVNEMTPANQDQIREIVAGSVCGRDVINSCPMTTTKASSPWWAFWQRLREKPQRAPRSKFSPYEAG